MATTGKAATASALPDGSSTETFLTPQRIRVIGIAGGVVLLIGLIVWFMITAHRRKETYAANALEQANEAAAQGQTGVAVQGYTRVTQLYGGTGAAYEASLGIAKSRLVDGQNQLAITSLDQFLKSNPPATYASTANELLGAANENLGQYGAAEMAYRKASDLATLEFRKGNDLLDVGRAARLAGKLDEAKAAYNDIITKYPNSGVETEARIRLAELTQGQ